MTPSSSGFKKRDNFIRLAEKRLPNVLDSIRILGNLSNRSNYDYTPEMASEIISQIDNALDDIKLGFGLITEAEPAPEQPPPPPKNEADDGYAVRGHPTFDLDDWKADPTTKSYREWLTEKLDELDASISDFHKRSWRR